MTGSYRGRVDLAWRLDPNPDLPHAVTSLYDIACAERTYAIRLVAMRQIAEGGSRSLAALADEFQRRWDRDHGETPPSLQEDQDRSFREREVSAWLAPLLCYFDDSELAAGPDDEGGSVWNLDRWLGDLATVDPRRPENQPNLSAEIALAQGFRFAANIRADALERGGGGLTEHGRKRARLMEQTEQALAHSRFWFSQLILVQALTLWALPDDPREPIPLFGHGSDPYQQIDYWVRLAGERAPVVEGRPRPAGRHPFVLEAGRLAKQALVSRRPENFLWIDEARVARQVGTVGAGIGPSDPHTFWILPSVGWSTLAPAAQRLVGDILLLANLADRGDSPIQREDRLRRADRIDLPPCLTRDRGCLAPHLTVGSAQVTEPGSTCADDCAFRLCPYPPRGKPAHREELPEGFCRKLKKLASRPAWWQERVSRRRLRAFWSDMAIRDHPPDHGS